MRRPGKPSGPSILLPGSTAAVVLGAHDWTDAGMTRAPSFLRSAKGIVQYLLDSAGLKLDPPLVLDLVDDLTPATEQLARIRDTLNTLLRERRDEGRPVADLLVYYVGHGYTDDQGHLSMLVRRSRKGLESVTGIRASDLAQVLRVAAPQQRRMVVLDCCFSEAAAKGFVGQSGSLDQAVAASAAKDLRDDHPQRGTLLLCSSPTSEISIGPPTDEYTLFTGAVLDVLRYGAPGRAGALSFADLRDEAYDRMVIRLGADAPRPALHQTDARQGDLTRMPAFPNKTARPVAAPTLQLMPAPNLVAQPKPADRIGRKGDIFLGKVVRVEASLEAAFVDFGGAKTGFLPRNEIHPDYYQIPISDRQIIEWRTADPAGERPADGAKSTATDTDAPHASDPLPAESHKQPRLARPYRIQEVIRPRQIMLVQIAREAKGTRGALVTTYLSLAGRFVVFVVNAPPESYLSGRLASDADHGRLQELAMEVGASSDSTWLLRETGLNQPRDALKRDCSRLLKVWDEIRGRTLQSNAPSLIYEGPH